MNKLKWVASEARPVPTSAKPGDYMIAMSITPRRWFEVGELIYDRKVRGILSTYCGLDENPFDLVKLDWGDVPMWSYFIAQSDPMHDRITAYIMALRMGTDILSKIVNG